MGLIDKDIVIEKINELKKRARELYGCSQFDTAYNKVLESINAIEEVSQVDLEKELEIIDNTLFDLDGVAVQGATKYITVNDIKEIVKHFYELGLRKNYG